MKHIITLLAAAGLMTAFFSCDKIEEGKYRQIHAVDTTGTDTNKYVRKVLLEEYTGHQCPNCPEASATAVSLKDTYKAQLVVIAIHSGFFARTNASGAFSYNFKCQAGNELNAAFSIGDNAPSGTINRKGFPDPKKDVGNWSVNIDSISRSAPWANIKIANTYNSSSRQVGMNIETQYLTTLNNVYKLAVYVTEDSIVNWQKNKTQDVPDYVHRHVLRGAINTTFGDTLSKGPVVKGNKFTKSYTYTLNSTWNEKHCALVAVLFNASTYEVVQVEEKHITP